MTDMEESCCTWRRRWKASLRLVSLMELSSLVNIPPTHLLHCHPSWGSVMGETDTLPLLIISREFSSIVRCYSSAILIRGHVQLPDKLCPL